MPVTIIKIIIFFFLIYFAISLFGLIILIITKKIDLSLKYYNANRESTHLAPNPKKFHDAIIQVYSARAFSWRGLLSVHTWIAFKFKNAEHYEVLQVLGWRKYRGLHPLLKETDIPDRAWYGQIPKVILDIRGKKAEALIAEVIKAADSYPYQGYQIWPGPNSNTFTAFVGRQVPGLKLALPANALGKDYLGNFTFLSKVPSGTGYQFSLWGVLGFSLSIHEGLEINFLSLVIGISPLYLVIKLPCLGDIGISRLD